MSSVKQSIPMCLPIFVQNVWIISSDPGGGSIDMITVETIAVEAITVEMITIETIASCADPGGGQSMITVEAITVEVDQCL